MLDRERENELISESKRGNRRAMETLVKEYERPVFNAAYRMLANRDDAADVTQATFLKAFEKLSQFNPAFRFFSWIYRITMNESIDMLKQRQRAEPLPDSIAATDPLPDASVEASKTGRQVQAALMELDYPYITNLVRHQNWAHPYAARIVRGEQPAVIQPIGRVHAFVESAFSRARHRADHHAVLRIETRHQQVFRVSRYDRRPETLHSVAGDDPDGAVRLLRRDRQRHHVLPRRSLDRNLGKSARRDADVRWRPAIPVHTTIGCGPRTETDSSAGKVARSPWWAVG